MDCAQISWAGLGFAFKPSLAITRLVEYGPRNIYFWKVKAKAENIRLVLIDSF